IRRAGLSRRLLCWRTGRDAVAATSGPAHGMRMVAALKGRRTGTRGLKPLTCVLFVHAVGACHWPQAVQRRERPCGARARWTGATRRMPFVDIGLMAAMGGIVLVDLALSGDNALVIGAAAARLPARQRQQALFWGALGALLFRLALATAAT